MMSDEKAAKEQEFILDNTIDREKSKSVYNIKEKSEFSTESDNLRFSSEYSKENKNNNFINNLEKDFTDLAIEENVKSINNFFYSLLKFKSLCCFVFKIIF